VLTLVYRGRHDGEEEVVSCYEAADRGERTAGVEGGERAKARLDHIRRIYGVARGLQLDHVPGSSAAPEISWHWKNWQEKKSSHRMLVLSNQTTTQIHAASRMPP